MAGLALSYQQSKLIPTTRKNMNFLHTIKTTTTDAQKANSSWYKDIVIKTAIERIQQKAKQGGSSIYVPEHWGETTASTVSKQYFKKEGFTIVKRPNGFNITW
jgi:hypothetical protein